MSSSACDPAFTRAPPDAVTVRPGTGKSMWAPSWTTVKPVSVRVRWPSHMPRSAGTHAARSAVCSALRAVMPFPSARAQSAIPVRASSRRAGMAERSSVVRVSVASPYIPWPTCRSPRRCSGCSSKYALTRVVCPSIRLACTVSHSVLAGSCPGSRRRKTSRSVSASVPAARRCAPVGRRTAPIRSAIAFISRRAAGFPASRVNDDDRTATSPPGRVRARDLMMKWLCIEWPPALWRGSWSTRSAKGTLPTTASKCPAR
ncbi:hypothetical protein SA2016_4136 (plasmid) [Sinomonas atrocyanea]|uniref:Uncharacterized protein n=1 Tax=Sinomonas atrocyanea TaxID=37927 RepID=A0A127A5M2_9MICC|nr:hypothetical protein SA2016_4136 [Sinomonas atrocyanea]